MPQTKAGEIVIPKTEREVIQVAIQGLTPLLCNSFSEGQKGSIRDKQQQKAKAARGAKDPEKCYRESQYHTSDGRLGFPASGIKKACVDAVSFISGVTKVQARGAFYVLGDILPIIGEPRIREDVVRLGGKGADLRYRAEFPVWEIVMNIMYNPRVISPANIINLLENAGFSIGIGDWRPQKSGSFGTFRVKTN